MKTSKTAGANSDKVKKVSMERDEKGAFMNGQRRIQQAMTTINTIPSPYYGNITVLQKY